MIGQTLGHYRIIENIGAAGMGVVYRAHDGQLDRDVALKILPGGTSNDAKAQSRLRDEARIAATLNHPHICTIYEVGETEGQVYVAMEYVDGKTLKHLLTEGLPAEACIRYALQISEALACAHSHGILHRDMKSSNVVISSEGRAKVLDFGLARRVREQDLEITRSNVSISQQSGLAGSFHYMAPEILQGKTPDARSDIWSFGVMLYEMANGTLPFQGRTAYELTSAILHDRPKFPDPPKAQAGVTAVIQRCLTKEPNLRYQTAGEVRSGLESVQLGQSGAPASFLGERKDWRHLTAGLAATMALLVLSVVLISHYLPLKRWSSRAPIPKSNYLAVLPPDTPGGDSDTAAFANGLTETLTAALTELTDNHPLQVIPANEIRTKGITTLEQAHEEFGANLGLEIDLHRSGEMVRINYHLIDAKTLQQLRGGTVTARASDAFALEDQVSAGVVKALQIELEPQEQRALAAHGTAQPAAYDYYLRGRGYLQSSSQPENIESAISVFNRALELDPNYSLAYAGLGLAYWSQFELKKDSEWAKRAELACQRSVELRSEQATGHVCLGTVLNGTGKYEDALSEFERAAQLEPTDDAVNSGLAATYESLGRADEAEKTYRQAISLRPNYPATYNWLGGFYERHARYQDAAEMFKQVIALAPDSFVGYTNLGSIYLLQGRYADAIPLLQQSFNIRRTAETSSNLGTAYFQMRDFSSAASTYEDAVKLDSRNCEVWGNLGDAYYWAPGLRDRAPAAYRTAISLAQEKLKINPRDANLLSYLAGYYAMLGQRQMAVEYLERALKFAPQDPNVLFNAALVHEQLGDTDEAITWLQKAVGAGISPSVLSDSPNFDNLRDDSRFRQLLNHK